MNFREFLNLFRAGREGQGKELEPAKISVRPSEGMAEGGCGYAMPHLISTLY